MAPTGPTAGTEGLDCKSFLAPAFPARRKPETRLQSTTDIEDNPWAVRPRRRASDARELGLGWRPELWLVNPLPRLVVASPSSNVSIFSSTLFSSWLRGGGGPAFYCRQVGSVSLGVAMSEAPAFFGLAAGTHPKT